MSEVTRLPDEVVDALEDLKNLTARVGPRPTNGHQAMNLTAGGFMAYVLRKTEIVACALESPGWAHHYYLAVDSGVFEGPIPAPFLADGQWAFVGLRGWDVVLNATDALDGITIVRDALKGGIPKNYQKRANWRTLALMPALADFLIGAGIASDWRTRPGILGTVTLSNGTVSAQPTHYTYETVWKWKARGGKDHKQALADILDYSSHEASGFELVFTRPGSSKADYRVRISSDGGRLFVVGVPAGGWPDPDGPRQIPLELAHAHASLGLCDVKSDVRIVLRPASTPNDKKPKDREERIRIPGRINCGGRLLEE
jgi:hypothetical protein